ncbi:Transmembrane protein 180 [Seminavis robusta]|uniref:Transmembrane protein 180 n=1 Tax=Seminavis robusta TaxID=568900 RepID=A0A9N8EDL5_9STRA|nr:Transmembrane protein 180 [Seminavis robusta]|eukprot:Sro1022_g232340.1 Transmembrane protein 180 (557) ;mRNA; r:11319-12989
MSSTGTPSKPSHNKSHSSNNKSLMFYLGLMLAGTASHCLTGLFGLLHLQVFLEGYSLPLPVYSVGSTIFACINTANDVAGAWLVDSLTNCCGGKQRHELVGWSGCLFALCFLTPFFFGSSLVGSGIFWQGAHFVTSLSLYDTMFSFHCILIHSILSDQSSMSDGDRVTFLATEKIVSMFVPMVVSRAALAVFDTNNLQPLRTYLLFIAGMVSIMSLMAQKLLTPNMNLIDACKRQKKSKVEDDDDDDEKMEPLLKKNHDHHHHTTRTTTTKQLHFRQVVQDFVQHSNFRYWICMEMLLEGQIGFIRSFLKTFVDQLVLTSTNNGRQGGLSRETCDWFLSSQPALITITSLLLYIPIRRFGYAKLYSLVFLCNFLLSLGLILFVGGGHGWTLDYVDTSTTTPIVIFLTLYPVLTSAIAGCGFALAMADMILEMKVTKARQGRWDEPSLAGLFMGVNALFCKPVESVLPVTTATLLGNTTHVLQQGAAVQTVLFRLLVLPPLVCSVLQFWAWSHYDLHPAKTKVLRKEWESIEMTKNMEEENQQQTALKDESVEGLLS